MMQAKKKNLGQISPVKYSCEKGPLSACLPSNKQVTIIEMGGFHSTMIPVVKGEETFGGAAYVADAVVRIRQTTEPILISNGDVFTGQTTAVENGGDIVIQFMNQLKFDVMTLGIHDFDEGQEILAKRLSKAKFTTLAANLIDSTRNVHVSNTDHSLSMVKPYVILDRGMRAIAVIGIMKEETPTYQLTENLAGLTFESAKTTVMRWLPLILEKGPSIIVVQYNKTSEAEELATMMNDHISKWRLKSEGQMPLLVFIGGHLKQEPIHRCNYLIMQGTDRGYSLGIIKIKQQLSGNQPFPEYTVISDKWCLPDPKAAELVKEIKRRIEIQDQHLGTNKNLLTRERFKDSPIGILATEAMKIHTKAEMAFISSGTIKLDIKAGEIYASDIDQSIPFVDPIIIMKLTGKNVKEILEQSAKLEADAGGSGGKILQVAGINFDYDVKKVKGERVGRIGVNGEDLIESKIYVAAVSKYLADGGDGYSQFKQGDVIETSGDLKTAIKAYIKKVGILDIKRDMRIVYNN